MAPQSSGPKTGRVPVLLSAPATRTWWTDAVAVGIWASTVAVVALWMSNGGLVDLATGSGIWVISLGRLTGLLSSNLLLLQVMAMARITWVERAIGQDRITRVHRILGFSSVALLLAHTVLTTAGYAATGRTGFWTQFWSLTMNMPGMLLAVVGTVMLVMVAVVSVRAARRRLRYEAWHLLHLYAYLGAGLALPHQLWTGKDFISSPVATAYWWSLYALALLAVLVYRIGLPLYRSMSQALHVTSVVEETPGVVSVYATGPWLAQLPVAAGQFFVWRFCTGPGWTRGHPLSLSAAPTTEGLRTTIATFGDDGKRLANIAPGTRVLIEGPYGRLTPDKRAHPGLVLIGSGLGIAPLISLLDHAALTGSLDAQPATLIRRLRTAGPHPLQDELDAFADAGYVQVIDLIGHRNTSGPSWLPEQHKPVTGPDAIARMVPDIADSDVFVCGASPWVEALVRDLRSAGVTENALHVEHFTW